LSLTKYLHQVKPRDESYVNHVDRVQDLFITEKFGMVNFPNGVGGDKPQAGTRTIYPPVDGEDYAYPEGFPTLKKTDLLDINGESIGKSLDANTNVHFVAPATLHKPKGSWIAKVSLKGHDKPFDGYVVISHIKKPGGKSQKRVASGTKTQQECATYIKELCDKKGIEYKSEFTVAPSGSTIPDLVMTIDGKRIQFEIKGTNARKNEITFFDITARRTQNAKSKAGKIELDNTAELYINNVPELKNVFKNIKGEWGKLRRKRGNEGGAFHAIMEYYKSLDPTIGYAGDSEVVKSGKLPSVFKAVSGGLLKNIHNSILQHFTKGGDDYFVIHDRSSDTFEVYNVNKENDILKMPTLPQFKEFRLSTYGGPSAAGTRVGYKIKL
jgi:hypothetical protein